MSFNKGGMKKMIKYKNVEIVNKGLFRLLIISIFNMIIIGLLGSIIIQSISSPIIQTIVTLITFIFITFFGIGKLVSSPFEEDSPYNVLGLINVFTRKYNGLQVKDLDLTITSIVTPDGGDIRGFEYDSEVKHLKHIDRFYLGVENYPNSDFRLVREHDNSSMVDSVIKTYLDNGYVEVELDKENADYYWLRCLKPLEKMERVSLFNDKVYSSLKLKKGIGND